MIGAQKDTDVTRSAKTYVYHRLDKMVKQRAIKGAIPEKEDGGGVYETSRLKLQVKTLKVNYAMMAEINCRSMFMQKD